MYLPAGRILSARATLIVVLCVLAASGCGSGAPYAESSMTEATVIGRVSSSGKPINKGQVIFDPANANRRGEAARTAEIGQDGTYKLTTLIGENRVTVAIPGRITKPGSPHVQQVYKVQAGENTFDITVPDETRRQK
jgi:hypothetical protein